ncbi:uncharacterized protein LOC141724385 [Apium graveolens]|uniref:uncharacterized protein LOC141724385 n=1 Tax=Apium graveolens TaxID=4045 RepID=UPI003D7B5F60
MSSSLSKLSNIFRSTIATEPISKLPPKPTSKLPRKPTPNAPAKTPQPPKKFRMISDKLKLASSPDKFRIYRANNYVRRLAAANQHSLIQEAVKHQEQLGDVNDVGLMTKLMALYGRGGMFDNALQLFDKMPDKSCRSFNGLLAASLYAKKFDMTEQLFRELPEKYGFEVDIMSYNMLARSYCQSGSMDLALGVLVEMESNGVEPDLVTFNTLLVGLYRHKKLVEADKLLLIMESKNFRQTVRSYDPKMKYLIENDQIEEAVIVFDEMKSKGVKPDRLGYYLFIKGYIEKGNLEETKRWYDKLALDMVHPDRRIIKAVLPLVCEEGDLDYAIKLAKDSVKWRCIVNVQVLQDLLDKLVKASKVDEAKDLIALTESLHYYNKKLKLPAAK